VYGVEHVQCANKVLKTEINFVFTAILVTIVINGAHYLEIELLADHGVLLPPQMQGLTDEQVSELHLIDEWADKCVPSGGSVECIDPVGRRNGKGTSVFSCPNSPS